MAGPSAVATADQILPGPHVERLMPAAIDDVHIGELVGNGIRATERWAGMPCNRIDVPPNSYCAQAPASTAIKAWRLENSCLNLQLLLTGSCRHARELRGGGRALSTPHQAQACSWRMDICKQRILHVPTICGHQIVFPWTRYMIHYCLDVFELLFVHILTAHTPTCNCPCSFTQIGRAHV